MALLVYVDDLVLMGNNDEACSKLKRYLHDCFCIKDLGPLKYFLGIKVARNAQGVFLNQRKYALEIIDEYGLPGSKPTDFPMETNHKLALNDSKPLHDAAQYKRLIGKLIYLTITVPNLLMLSIFSLSSCKNLTQHIWMLLHRCQGILRDV